MNKAKVLVIDDDPEMLALMRYQLGKQGFEVTGVETGEGALALAASQPFDVALTDLLLPDLNGLDVVRRLREISPDTEVIMVTGYGSVPGAIDAIRAGAFYFIEKPVKFAELFALLEKALERRQQAAEIVLLRDRLKTRDSYYNLIGSSRAMQNLYEIVDRVAESDANVMIVGESGTGKELIANAIHYRSRRAKKHFVKINCSTLPRDLIESELFGHAKGAFTGASGEKNGLIAQANGGSLLLDEIGEMPLELQPKLLRVLQERVYYRVGSEKALEANFRLISATNRNPLEAIAEGKLRDDLYYRINTIEVRVPPLRERAEDVQHLAEHFLRVFAEKYQRPVAAISQQAYARMFEYPWPGNVRELQNTMERAVLLCRTEVIEETEIPLARPVAVTIAPPEQTAAVTAESAPEAIAPKPVVSEATRQNGELSVAELARIIVSRAPKIRPEKADGDLFSDLEGAVLKAALARSRGNKQAAASLLGVYRPRLYNLLRRHQLQDLIRNVSGDAEDEADDVTETGPAPEPFHHESLHSHDSSGETEHHNLRMSV
ncbi:MAG: sigma-54-dependent transcriptional regulator [Blastocatellia bacterium]